MDKVIQHFNKGEVIIPEGSQGDRAYKILNGEVLVCKKNDRGRMVPIAKLGVGELFGEMYLFEGSGLRTASAIAFSDVRVEVFFQETIQHDLEQAPQEVRQMLQSFTNRLHQTTGNFASMAREKTIVELPDGTMRVIDGSK
jgi:CRP/FNR family cyclic AMP-dependent transcriptional regulator